MEKERARYHNADGTTVELFIAELHSDSTADLVNEDGEIVIRKCPLAKGPVHGHAMPLGKALSEKRQQEPDEGKFKKELETLRSELTRVNKEHAATQNELFTRSKDLETRTKEVQGLNHRINEAEGALDVHKKAAVEKDDQIAALKKALELASKFADKTPAEKAKPAEESKK